MYKSINDFERRVAVSFKSELCNETKEFVFRRGVGGGGDGEGCVLSIVKMAEI